VLAGLCCLGWAYEIIAYAWSISPHLGPGILHAPLYGSAWVKSIGLVLAGLGVLLYAIALHHLGESWKMGVDPAKPGPLVTHGVYRWSRHPIYLAFDFIFVGSFLAHGRTIFLLYGLLWVALLHLAMLREERFLSQRHGETYRDYAQRVRRYL
jgi:protein-S-isoprenylcysteine O-methyltransferase Ste14